MVSDVDAGSTYLTGTIGTAANNIVQLDSTAKLPAVDGSQLTGISTSVPVIVLRDEKSAGTGGGASTTGSWVTRVLNTEATDTGNHCTLSSNQFTLSAGTYEVIASAPFYKTNNTAMRLYNVTDSSTVLRSTSHYMDNSYGVSSICHIIGYFTVAASKALEIQYQCGNAASAGLGQPLNLGDTEVYTQVMLRKVG
tara:strand:- start:143 stop:727 length:585 start_codon:yes stop_codon:yes gene_type:complete